MIVLIRESEFHKSTALLQPFQFIYNLRCTINTGESKPKIETLKQWKHSSSDMNVDSPPLVAVVIVFVIISSSSIAGTTSLKSATKTKADHSINLLPGEIYLLVKESKYGASPAIRKHLYTYNLRRLQDYHLPYCTSVGGANSWEDIFEI